MNNIEVYENKEFWKTYNQLYWHNKPNQELSNAAEQISKLLKSDIKQPLYVLSLGLGTGTLELPLLAKIQEYTQRTVRLVGIEQSGTALRVTTKQLSNGLNSLPTETEEMLERIDLASAEENSNSSFWSADNHWLQLDDLDFEPSTNKLFESFPSNWLTRLKENMANDLPHDGFDILISSFCLFHLEWWQHTLIMALSQVKEGGLFLHSHMDGDEHILEGRSTPKIEEKRIRALGLCHSSNIAKKVFNTFFEHQDVKTYLTEPRFASAAIPIGILDTLQHFESRGLERLPDVKYLIPSKCSKKDYLSLLETRGFSTFRFIEENIGGSEAYNEILEDVRSLENTNGSDNLLFDLVWTIYRVETDKLISEPIMQKFLRKSTDSSSNIPIDYEYEMKESIRYSPSIRHGLTVENGNLAEYLVKQLSIAGLLNSSCIGGDIGFVKDLKSPMQYWGFINPLYKPQAKTQLTEKKTFYENFAARLAIYLMLIDSNYHQSVGKSLMKELLPYSLTPIAVSYEIISNEEDEDFNASIELDIHSGFKHINFKIWIPCSLLKKIDLIGEQLTSKVLEDLDTKSNIWIFKPPSSEDYTFDLEKLNNIINATDIENLKYQCINSIEQLGGVEPIFINKLKEIIRDNSGRNFNVILWLALLKPHNYILVIPATYYIRDEPIADNLVVLIYDSLQSIAEVKFQKEAISHEVCKVNLLYSQQGISTVVKTAEKEGYEESNTSFNHETSNILEQLLVSTSNIKGNEAYKQILNNCLYYVAISANQKLSNITETILLEKFFNNILTKSIDIFIDINNVKNPESIWEKEREKQLKAIDMTNLFIFIIHDDFKDLKTQKKIYLIEKMMYAIFLNTLNHYKKGTKVIISLSKPQNNLMQLEVSNTPREVSNTPRKTSNTLQKRYGTENVIKNLVKQLEGNENDIVFKLHGDQFITSFSFPYQNVFN